MIFIGDIACPHNKVKEFIGAVSKIAVFHDEVVVLNLEANILDEDAPQRPLTLHNSPNVLDGFRHCKKIIVSLANNHMYDYPNEIQPTKEYLESIGVGVFGLVESNGLVLPYEYQENGVKKALFGHCWRLYTHSNRNIENNVRISDAYYDEFAEMVIAYTKANPNTKVYCFMHWNYDLEQLVLPMHIKFARYLIDNGVESVIGCHSHRPQGAELYKGKAIAYGLGNFYLPSGLFFGGKLTYPECSRETYGLSLCEDGVRLLWFDTDKNDNVVEFRGISEIDSERIQKISAFVSMSEKGYQDYFRQHRSKRLLVPVFDDFQGKSYRCKEWFALTRVKLIRFIKKILNN